MLDDAIHQFREQFDTLFALIENYPQDRRDQPGACGEWSPRQVLAHFSGWIIEAQRRYGEFALGVEGNIEYDLDGFNARSINIRKGMDWNSTVKELRSFVQDFHEQARAIPRSKRADERYSEWLLVMATDCADHTLELREFIEDIP